MNGLSRNAIYISDEGQGKSRHRMVYYGIKSSIRRNAGDMGDPFLMQEEVRRGVYKRSFSVDFRSGLYCFGGEYSSDTRAGIPWRRVALGRMRGKVIDQCSRKGSCRVGNPPYQARKRCTCDASWRDRSSEALAASLVLTPYRW